MSDGLDRFNRIPQAEAELRLHACFASTSWASQVAARRPYADFRELLDKCESVWSELAPDEWLGAIKGHPRIGEGGGHAPASSEREQRGVSAAPPETLAALAVENRAYEARFGHVFMISASGLTADDVLVALRRRLRNDPATEADLAAGELRKITRLRLERMLSE
ncbi:MAG TPA: 2-oxo-4-hydroxy-4-carboxy-5-ureidoimidazoline decarboxylase [Candidatus Dormibacteraeota bacterium]